MEGDIVVVGATSHMAGRLINALKALGREPIGLVRDDPGGIDAPLITNWRSNPDAAEAIKRAKIVYHMCGTVNPLNGNSYADANIVTTEVVAAHAVQGDVQRIIFVSAAEADPTAKNRYLRTKGHAENVLMETGIPTVILRSGPVIGAPLSYPPGGTEDAMIAAPGKSVTVFGSGSQSLRAIYQDDVTNVLVRALDGPAGVYDLVGPTPMTVDDLVNVVNQGRPPKITHVPAPMARLIGLLAPGVHPTFVDLLLRGVDGDPEPTQTAFGVTFTSLGSVWTSQ